MFIVKSKRYWSAEAGTKKTGPSDQAADTHYHFHTSDTPNFFLAQYFSLIGAQTHPKYQKLASNVLLIYSFSI